MADPASSCPARTSKDSGGTAELTSSFANMKVQEELAQGKSKDSKKALRSKSNSNKKDDPYAWKSANESLGPKCLFVKVLSKDGESSSHEWDFQWVPIECHRYCEKLDQFEVRNKIKLPMPKEVNTKPKPNKAMDKPNEIKGKRSKSASRKPFAKSYSEEHEVEDILRHIIDEGKCYLLTKYRNTQKHLNEFKGDDLKSIYYRVKEQLKSYGYELNFGDARAWWSNVQLRSNIKFALQKLFEFQNQDNKATSVEEVDPSKRTLRPRKNLNTETTNDPAPINCKKARLVPSSSLNGKFKPQAQKGDKTFSSNQVAVQHGPIDAPVSVHLKAQESDHHDSSLEVANSEAQDQDDLPTGFDSEDSEDDFQKLIGKNDKQFEDCMIQNEDIDTEQQPDSVPVVPNAANAHQESTQPSQFPIVDPKAPATPRHSLKSTQPFGVFQAPSYSGASLPPVKGDVHYVNTNQVAPTPKSNLKTKTTPTHEKVIVVFDNGNSNSLRKLCKLLGCDMQITKVEHLVKQQPDNTNNANTVPKRAIIKTPEAVPETEINDLYNFEKLFLAKIRIFERMHRKFIKKLNYNNMILSGLQKLWVLKMGIDTETIQQRRKRSLKSLYECSLKENNLTLTDLWSNRAEQYFARYMSAPWDKLQIYLYAFMRAKKSLILTDAEWEELINEIRALVTTYSIEQQQDGGASSSRQSLVHNVQIDNAPVAFERNNQQQADDGLRDASVLENRAHMRTESGRSSSTQPFGVFQGPSSSGSSLPPVHGTVHNVNTNQVHGVIPDVIVPEENGAQQIDQNHGGIPENVGANVVVPERNVAEIIEQSPVVIPEPGANVVPDENVAPIIDPNPNGVAGPTLEMYFYPFEFDLISEFDALQDQTQRVVQFADSPLINIVQPINVPAIELRRKANYMARYAARVVPHGVDLPAQWLERAEAIFELFAGGLDELSAAVYQDIVDEEPIVPILNDYYQNL